MDMCCQCKNKLNETSSRLIQDTCGHHKCRKCLLIEENGCKQCADEMIAEGKKGVDLSHKVPESPTKSTNEKQIEKLSASSICEKKTKRKPIVLQSHIAVIDGNPLIYKCLLCKKSFKTKAHVRYHDFCQGEDRPLQCDTCGSSFITKAHLQYHIRSHSGDRPFVCNECGRGFTQKGKMTRHMISHTGKKPFQCPECDKTFGSRQALSSHSSVHSGERPHVCVQCGHRFSQLTNLKKHSFTHNGVRSFVCEDCGKSFSLKWSLDIHRKTHSRVRSFSCPTCGRAFSTQKDMRRHCLIHTDARPYSCSICDTKFRRKDNFERHLKNTHPEKYGIEDIQNGSQTNTTKCMENNSTSEELGTSCGKESVSNQDKRSVEETNTSSSKGD